ncbi:uncharacterized protein METZ01_LOCUS509796, partial [marine metagenome]
MAKKKEFITAGRKLSAIEKECGTIRQRPGDVLDPTLANLQLKILIPHEVLGQQAALLILRTFL